MTKEQWEEWRQPCSCVWGHCEAFSAILYASYRCPLHGPTVEPAKRKPRTVLHR